MTAQQVRRHPKGTRHGGRFAANPAAAAADVAAPPKTENWDAVVRQEKEGPILCAVTVRADTPTSALKTAEHAIYGESPAAALICTHTERDAAGREWHWAFSQMEMGRRLYVSPAGCRAGSRNPFTSTAGGFKARFEYHQSGGWGYTAGEERVSLADCPATNVIAQTERQRMALGQVCADLLNEGRLAREELPKFHGALIRSTANPYRPPTFAGNIDALLSALARAGCAAQIAALLPGNEYDPTMWAQNDSPEASFMPTKTRNTSGLPLPPAWREFVPHPATLVEAVKAVPRSSTPADGTLLGSAHNRPSANPHVDCLGAWAAETVRAQKQLFTYGLGCSNYLAHGQGLKRMPLSIISRSPETFQHGKKSFHGRIPCGTVEALLFMLPDIQQRSTPLLCAEVQAAAARRSELAAHLAVGGMLPATHVVDALLDDPRSEWCATESEFRRKIVTAAVSQTADPADSLNTRADRLIAEHVIGGPSEKVTEMELRCLRTALNRRAHMAMHAGIYSLGPTLYDDRSASKSSYRSGYDANAGVGKLAGGAAVAFDSEFPLPETAERVTARLGAYTRAVNRLRKQDAEGASAGRLFLQTLLTLPGLPFKERAKMFAFERVVTSDLYRQSRLVAG